MEELIRRIPGHRQYGAAALGSVFRMEGGNFPGDPIAQSKHKVRSKNPDQENYYLYCTMLTRDDKDNYGNDIDMRCTQPRGVHRMVCLAWHGPAPQGKPWVNHKDGNKRNNTAPNLEWSSISENIQHKFDTGLYKTPTGKDHWKFGVKTKDSTKDLQSASKLGEKHPKFKGWYVKDGIEYASAIIAGKALGIPQKRVLIHTKLRKYGWSFKPKEAPKVPETT